MPRREDIHSILILGSGPIVIGQACEFDYSGTQALKALKEEGYRVILVNSNPATIMTDPQFADRTYVEPITPDVVEAIIRRERPDALLPTMGGQTALNVASDLARRGVLEKYGVEMIGASYEAIEKAEDRERFREAMRRIGLETPASGFATHLREAMEIVQQIGFPVIIRPSYTLGGTGGSVVYNVEEFQEAVVRGLEASPIREVLIEESVLGWKEFELEVMRDRADNVVIVCSIENLDPMGVHTGDSITVAPAQTLTDREYQRMRDAAIRIIREIGVDTGGSNIQFAIHPENGRMVVIEMNPRVSRSSALASKATGFPIARIAAKLAVGYTLDEIPNDITRETPASFEPTLDYVVVKIPRFAFEKFSQADPTLTTQMKSVGEVMAIGRTFKEALQKAIRSLEIGEMGLRSRLGLDGRPSLSPAERDRALERVRERLRIPNWERIWYLADAFRLGLSVEETCQLSAIDPWFLRQIQELVAWEARLLEAPWPLPPELLREAKALGFSDARIASLLEERRGGGITEAHIRAQREAQGLRPVYKRVDTCAAEFEAYTPYLYSTYESECEAWPTTRRKVAILGSGPNRIGQGIEFDYCCVHAAFALREEGFETIMINCNPETVSTDYDTSDRLYFEPLTVEDVLHILHLERPEGVIVQLGGQTPLKLARFLEAEGFRILGTSPDAIDRAEDRARFREVVARLGLRQPQSGIARSLEEARAEARRIGYPVLVRPSYVLGGRAMEILYDEAGLVDYMERIRALAYGREIFPLLLDQYLEDAVEVDVDALADGEDVVIGGILEHIEEAGVHSGDSACSLPPYSLDWVTVDEVRAQVHRLARELGVVGLLNVQFAIKNGGVYVLEVNPRASRTVPFVSKAIGVPLAQFAARIMVGRRLRDLGFTEERIPPYLSVKESVFPFTRFPGVDPLLGPEMKSTGEVMGIDQSFGLAYAKSQMGAGVHLPRAGKVFVSVKDRDKPGVVDLVKRLLNLGFSVEATRGTAAYLRERGIPVEVVNKVAEGRPHIVDHLRNREIALVINTVSGQQAREDSYPIRQTAVHQGVPYYTTLAGARAVVRALENLAERALTVRSLQEYHRDVAQGLKPFRET